MSFAGLLTQVVSILPYEEGEPDEYNDAEPTFGDPIEVNAYLEQKSADENQEDRETAVSGWRLFLPATASLSHRDRVVLDDRTFEVVGSVNEVWNPRTASVHHIEADLALVDGLPDEVSS